MALRKFIPSRRVVKKILEREEEAAEKEAEKVARRVRKRSASPRITSKAMEYFAALMRSPDHTVAAPDDFTRLDELALLRLLTAAGYVLEKFKGVDGFLYYRAKNREEIALEKERTSVRQTIKSAPLWIRTNPIYLDMWAATHALNRNFVQFNVGPTGAGKSWGAIRFAYDLYDHFDVRKHVFFRPLDLLHRINAPDLEKGEAHVWDEVGIQINSRRFYTLKNLITSYVVQTFRFRNTILIETVPSFDLVDAQVRKLSHGLMEFLPRTIRHPEARATYFFISYSPRTGKVYYIRPRVRDKKATYVIRIVSIPRVPDHIAEVYEKMKSKYLGDFYDRLADMAKALEEMEKNGGDFGSKQARVASVINEIINDLDYYVDKRTGKLLLTRAISKFGLNSTDYSTIRSAVIAELEAQGLIEKRGRAYYLIGGA